MRYQLARTLPLVFGIVVGAISVAAAQVHLAAGSDGISVYGTGEVLARPNWIEIDLRVSGKAELTGDALVKYRDGKKRLIDALEKVGFADLSTEERGVTIGPGIVNQQPQRFVNGVPQNTAKPQIEVSSTVRARLKNIRDAETDEVLKTVGRLIDVAQDAGVSVALTPAELQQLRQHYHNYNLQGGTNVRFVVADLAELREKAYERAVADARDRASRLAKLNHVKLGGAVSVQEVQVAGDAQTLVRTHVAQAPWVAPESSDQPRLSSTMLADIPVRVKLLVRFAIQPADPATAQK